jgi:hypothetical protein
VTDPMSGVPAVVVVVEGGAQVDDRTTDKCWRCSAGEREVRGGWDGAGEFHRARLSFMSVPRKRWVVVREV